MLNIYVKNICWAAAFVNNMIEPTTAWTAVSPPSASTRYWFLHLIVLHPRIVTIYFTHRAYVRNNVDVYVHGVDSVWLLSYFWCTGVTSVTTNQVAEFTSFTTPVHRMVSFQ